MRVAIVHDQLCQRGGAERVAVALHRMFPDAPIYTSVYDPDRTYPELRDADVRASFVGRLPRAGTAFRAYFPLFAVAFERMRLRGYDLVVSSSSGWAHAARAEDGFHLCYLHNTARWLYQTDEYLGDGGPVPAWANAGVRAALRPLRRWDARAARRPDAYVANSRNVQARLKRVHGRDAAVVPPPVDVERFPFPPPADGSADEAYYLVVARLLPYKRVDLAVRVCSARGLRLVVVGDGPARASLEAMAGPTVRFAGRVGEDELLRLYRNCRALVQSGEEDFGIAPLEANASGRPVVAYNAGGALETVVDGTTGVLFPAQTDAALAEALDRVEATRWDATAIRRHAETFGERRFAEDLRRIIDERTGARA